MARNCMKRLKERQESTNSLVCIGLDPDLTKIPEHLLKFENPIFEFNRGIIGATADLVCTFKPQIAFYSAVGAEVQLEMTIEFIHKHHPEILVILDAKRGDIGSTAKMYAQEVFDRYKADAVTVNPYLGFDAIEPFLEREDKGVVILCRTSNPGARDIQDLEIEGTKLYRIVATKASNEWNRYGNVLLVVGATYPEELAEIRSIVGDMPFLVPGIGAQGGNVEKSVKAGLNSKGKGMIISSSRGIIYASKGEDFAQAARREAEKLRDEINQYR